MNDSQISVRYAKALFESALEQKILDNVRADMEQVMQVSGIKEFQYLLVNPVIKDTQKRKAIEEILKDEVHPLSLSLLNLVIKNGRDQFIPAIARNYIDLYKKHKGIKSASFISATDVPDEMKKKIENIISNTLDSPVELQAKSNSELIGGFVIRIENQQYDASVATSLKEVKKQLLNQS